MTGTSIWYKNPKCGYNDKKWLSGELLEFSVASKIDTDEFGVSFCVQYPAAIIKDEATRACVVVPVIDVTFASCPR
jgi:hypothetical protein